MTIILENFLRDDPSSLYDGEYWAITIDGDKINCSYLTLWLKEFPFGLILTLENSFLKKI